MEPSPIIPSNRSTGFGSRVPAKKISCGVGTFGGFRFSRMNVAQKENAPASRGVRKLFERAEGLGTLRIDLDVVALGVPLVDDIVDLLDVALGVELHLAEHRIPGAGLDRLHHLLRVGRAG